VVRHRPVIAVDDLGNERPTGEYSDVRIKAMWVGRTRSSLLLEGRNVLVTGARAMFPAGTDLDDDDELTALGERWRIIGLLRGNRPTNPDKEWHVTADLERVGD
jgi:hypothetical protein